MSHAHRPQGGETRRDPRIADIEREGYALLAALRPLGALQQIDVLLPRAEAGLPFLGQVMPGYADVITELCAAVREFVNTEESF